MGPFLLTQALAPRLADGARVANITSELGSIGSVTRFGTPSYNISKAAQNMATVLLASALRPRGITVVALHPGWVQTDMGGTGATITPGASVDGLLRVIDGLKPADSGRFLDWRGQPLPW
jgi:NAD(P)-dependent dehydrogenase (short-subunit alcohol dehydrogenase family)